MPILPMLDWTVWKEDHEAVVALQGGRVPIQALAVYLGKADLFKLKLNLFRYDSILWLFFERKLFLNRFFALPFITH